MQQPPKAYRGAVLTLCRVWASECYWSATTGLIVCAEAGAVVLVQSMVWSVGPSLRSCHSCGKASTAAAHTAAPHVVLGSWHSGCY